MKAPGGAASPSCDTCLWRGARDLAGVPLPATQCSATGIETSQSPQSQLPRPVIGNRCDRYRTRDSAVSPARPHAWLLASVHRSRHRPRRAGGLDRQIVVSEHGDVGITSGDVNAGGWTTVDEWDYIVVSLATPVRTLFDSTLSPMRSIFRQPCFRWFAVREAVFQVPHHHAQLQRARGNSFGIDEVEPPGMSRHLQQVEGTRVAVDEYRPARVEGGLPYCGITEGLLRDHFRAGPSEVLPAEATYSPNQRALAASAGTVRPSPGASPGRRCAPACPAAVTRVTPGWPAAGRDAPAGKPGALRLSGASARRDRRPRACDPLTGLESPRSVLGRSGSAASAGTAPPSSTRPTRIYVTIRDGGRCRSGTAEPASRTVARGPGKAGGRSRELIVPLLDLARLLFPDTRSEQESQLRCG